MQIENIKKYFHKQTLIQKSSDRLIFYSFVNQIAIDLNHILSYFLLT